MAHAAVSQPAGAPLGPLPPELSARILLSLPLLDRIRAEGTCRAWLALLRAPEQQAQLDTRAVLRACRAEGLRSESGYTEVVAKLARRAGASLRSLTVSGDAHAHEVLVALLLDQPPLTRLRALDVSAAACDHLLATLTLSPQDLRLERCQVHAGNLATLEDDALAALLARPLLAGGSLQLQRSVFHWGEDDEDDGVQEDPRALRMLRFGRVLSRCAWPAVRVCLERGSTLQDEAFPAGGAGLATLLEVFFAGLVEDAPAQPAAPRARCCLDVRGTALDVRDTARVAQAAPPHARLRFGTIVCQALADVAALPSALRPGRVVAATLLLSAPASLSAHAQEQVLRALRTCAEAAADEGADERGSDASDFRLAFAYDHQLAVDCMAPLCAWLRGDMLTALRMSLATADDVAAVLASLGPRLRSLRLSGKGVTGAGVQAVVHALQAGPLAALTELRMPEYILRIDDARALGHALRRRAAPLSLAFHTPARGDAVLALRELMRTAHARSGVPLWAAGQIALTLHRLQQRNDKPALRDALEACADAVPQLLAMLQTQHDAAVAGGDEAEEPAAMNDDGDGDDDDADVELTDVPFEIGHVALFLMMLLDDAAPVATARALLGAAPMLLFAKFVCRMRAGDESATLPARWFTLLLLRGLLRWTRDGYGDDVKPHVLCVIAAACHRTATTDENADRYRTAADDERLAAKMALLLTWSMSIDAECTAPRCESAALVLSTFGPRLLLRAIAGIAFSIRDEEQEDDEEDVPPLSSLGLFLSWSMSDVALLLAAAARFPALVDAFHRAPEEFGAAMDVLLGAGWARREGPVCAGIAYGALHDMLRGAPESALRSLAWESLLAFATAIQVGAQMPLAPPNEAPARQRLLARLQPDVHLLDGETWPASAAHATAAARAHASAASVLRILQCLPDHALRRAAHLHQMAAARAGAESADHAERAAWCTMQLHRGLLHWARHGRDIGGDDDDNTDDARSQTQAHTLALSQQLLAACTRAGQQWPDAPNVSQSALEQCRLDVLNLLLVVGAADGNGHIPADDALSDDSEDDNWATATAWLATHAARVFDLLAHLEARAPSLPPPAVLRDVSRTHHRALLLAAAARIRPLVAGFVRASAAGFADAMTALLSVPWAQQGGLSAAVAAYDALSCILQRARDDAALPDVRWHMMASAAVLARLNAERGFLHAAAVRQTITRAFAAVEAEEDLVDVIYLLQENRADGSPKRRSVS
jgi:hypothetical protein